MTRFLACILIMAIAGSSTAFGQITITKNQMPSSGDTLRYSIVNPSTTVDYALSGDNKTWDFSHVTSTGQGLYEYKTATQVNFAYFLFFGFSAYGLKIFDALPLGVATLTDGYDFYENSSSTFKAVGKGMEYNGIPSPSFYTDDDEIYQFPLDTGDRDSTTFRVNNDFAGIISFIQKGYRINEVEGWGTAITPFGSFECLKVKTTIIESDSIEISSVPLPSIPRTTIEYKWLAIEEKIPVFEIKGPEIAGQFTPTSIRYRENVIPPWLGINSEEINAKVTVKTIEPHSFLIEWPNAVGAEVVRLLDVSGQFVDADLSGSSGKYKLNLSGVNSGMYFLWIETPTFSEIVKFVR